MPEEKPLPGTKAAIGRGCTCVREGWQWDSASCIVHGPPYVVPSAPGICEHGEREWSCGECADRAASYAAYERDMRGLRHRRTNDFGAEP